MLNPEEEAIFHAVRRIDAQARWVARLPEISAAILPMETRPTCAV